jgi:hypothetical protein
MFYNEYRLISCSEDGYVCFWNLTLDELDGYSPNKNIANGVNEEIKEVEVKVK